jgi:tRNA pseudouridine55 synthase
MAAPDGLLVVDKPSGWTSHDVVSRCRRLAATRKVGHAGTLDPMATGVLVVGVGRATRLMGYLALTSKAYDATIRLGASTITDDAEGEVVATVDAGRVSDADVRRVVAGFTGQLQQVPSAVSAVKIAGKRSYARVRAGEEVALAARPIEITGFQVSAVRRSAGFVDFDASIECSSGTYVRALARDIGAELEVGGHLTALRRTRVGSYHIQQASTLEQLSAHEPDDLPTISMDATAQQHFAWYVVADEQVDAVRNGRAIHVQLRDRLDAEPAIANPGQEDSRRDEAGGPTEPSPPLAHTLSSYRPGQRATRPDAPAPVAVLAPGGRFLALYEQHGPVAKPVAVFAPA